MPARKPVTSLTLTEPQLEWLRARAARLGISQSDLIRRIVDAERQREETTGADAMWWHFNKP
jgi:hypothetical protein